jgi:hypothetical protein
VCERVIWVLANAGVTALCWVVCISLQPESTLRFCLLKLLFQRSPF